MPTRIVLRELEAPASGSRITSSQVSATDPRRSGGKGNRFLLSRHDGQNNTNNTGDEEDGRSNSRRRQLSTSPPGIIRSRTTSRPVGIIRNSNRINGGLSSRTSSHDPNNHDGSPTSSSSTSSYLPTGSSSSGISDTVVQQRDGSHRYLQPEWSPKSSTTSTIQGGGGNNKNSSLSSVVVAATASSNSRMTMSPTDIDYGSNGNNKNSDLPQYYKRNDGTIRGGGSSKGPYYTHQNHYNKKALGTTATTRRATATASTVVGNDIRASTRLMGYLIQLLACAVMLISVIQFYRGQQNERFIKILATLEEENATSNNSNGSVDVLIGDESTNTIDKRIFSSVNGPVYYWKLMGCVAVGSIGVAVSLVVVLVHFDTVCLPRLWNTLFRDGSKFEFLLLWTNVLFWIVGLYVCTSSLSVGEVQANVYFTTWIAVVSAVINCGVWRESAGLPSLTEQVSFHHRETTYNWLWTFLFVSIVAGSVSDIYVNREDMTLRLKGKVLDLSQRDWILILSLMWGFAGVCILAILLNHCCHHELSIKLWRRLGGSSGQSVILGWRQIEGLVILGIVVVFFWMIYEQTGVNGIVNGLNNAYFGVWGSFFNAVFTFGTWLRENRNIEFIVRENNDDHGKDVQGGKRSHKRSAPRVRFAPDTY